MFFPELTDRIGRLLRVKNPDEPATTLPPTGLSPEEPDRPMTAEERIIAEWLLRNAKPPALDFLPQLEVARVEGYCSCGCPTVHLVIPEGTPPAQSRDNPVGDAAASVGSDAVGVMLLQRNGYLTCLEIYDLSEIPHPYGLPNPSTLKPIRWNTGEEAADWK